MLKKENKINMVNALILNENNYILLVHNCKKYGERKNDRWEFPGGKVEEREKLEQAVIREVKEELGVRIKIIKRNGKKVFRNYETTTLEGKFLCRTYYAKIVDGEPGIQETEKEKIDKIEYASYDGLLHLNEQRVLAPNLVLALPKLKEYVG